MFLPRNSRLCPKGVGVLLPLFAAQDVTILFCGPKKSLPRPVVGLLGRWMWPMSRHHRILSQRSIHVGNSYLEVYHKFMVQIYTVGKYSIHGAFGLRFVNYIALNRLKTQLSMFFFFWGGVARATFKKASNMGLIAKSCFLKGVHRT